MNVPENWWESFFSGLIVDVWLKANTPEQTRLEADFLQKMLQVAPPAKFLDVPCGGGRHALALAERGYQLTGVDISPAFLEAAKSKEGSGKIQWEQRDMRDLPWGSPFDGAYSLGNSFGYLEDEGNSQFLIKVASVLKPGARFVLDTSYIAEVLLPILQGRTWHQIEDLLFLAERQYHPESSRLEVEYTCIRNGQIDKRSMSARIYSCREVCQLLRQAGFTDLNIYGSLDQKPFKLGSERLLLVGTMDRK